MENKPVETGFLWTILILFILAMPLAALGVGEQLARGRNSQPTEGQIYSLPLLSATVAPSPRPLGTQAAVRLEIPTAQDTPSITATSPAPPTATSIPTEIIIEPKAIPTETPIETPVPAPTAILFVSNGLGLSREQWEEVMGPGVSSPILYIQYRGGALDGGYDVLFRTGNVSLIERQWSTAQAISPPEAETIGEQLIPSDSILQEVYSPEGRSETTVRLYMSESLKARFDEGAWVGGVPGNFTIQYNTYDGLVTRLILAVGNNP